MPSFSIILKHLCFIIVSFQAFWMKILCNFGIELRICIKKTKKSERMVTPNEMLKFLPKI